MSDYREQEVALATGRLRVLCGGDGPPLVLLHHSWGGAGWSPFHVALASHFSVFAFDMPGYGGSERPEWAREPRDLAIIVARAIRQAAPGAVTLLGSGLGGFVAAELAVMNAVPLHALVLVGAAGVKPEAGEIMDQMMMSHADYARASCRDDAHFARVFGDPPGDDMKQLWDFSREMTARVTWKPYMFSRRLPPLLADLRVPTLLVWGGEDRVVPPECGAAYAARIPGARLEVVAGAGHLVEFEEPARVAALVAGLSRGAGAAGAAA